MDPTPSPAPQSPEENSSLESKSEGEEAKISASRIPGLFEQLGSYHEHLVRAIHTHSNGSSAPISAYVDAAGGLHGRLYVFADEQNYYGKEAEEVVADFRAHYGALMESAAIRSYLIIDHQTPIGETQQGAMRVQYHFLGEEPNEIRLPYAVTEEGYSYHGFEAFSQEENHQLFNTPLREGHNYYDEKVVIEAPTTTLENGVVVITANELDLNNLYAAELAP